MLQVEQYRYPNGPPIGTLLGSGIGALTGLDTAGKMPGSITAEIQRKTNARIAAMTLDQNIPVVLMY